MPNRPATQHRSVRVDDDLWFRLATAAEGQGTDRAGIIRDLIRWYLREPGARLPKRPE